MNFPKDNLDLTATMKALRKNRIGAYYVADKEELISLIKTFIPNETLVGCGDSVTLEELGVTDKDRVRIAAENACAEGESIHNMIGDVTPEQLYNALIVADALGREFLNQ